MKIPTLASNAEEREHLHDRNTPMRGLPTPPTLQLAGSWLTDAHVLARVRRRARVGGLVLAAIFR